MTFYTIVNTDIEKAFNSLSHPFYSVSKHGYGYDFIKSIELLLESQESCIIDAEITNSYFKLEKGARQGDAVSAYLFILYLEVLFLLVKANKEVEGIYIFHYTYLYTA